MGSLLSWQQAVPAANTEGGTRTLTPLRETDFESVASANSATPACLCIIPYSAANDKSGTDP
jgi:hypothetical protein